LAEVVELHRRLLQATGGAPGIRDLGALESAVLQPKATFGSADLYPTLIDKAAALCFALIQDHPFVDGNKRVGHAAMETFSFSTARRSTPLSTIRNDSSWISPLAVSIEPTLSTGCVSISRLSPDRCPSNAAVSSRERANASPRSARLQRWAAINMHGLAPDRHQSMI
jgi:hypothetical protein